jgi:ketopantoate hydroxymethyltransferase
MVSSPSLDGAVKSYIASVKDLSFPALENSF